MKKQAWLSHDPLTAGVQGLGLGAGGLLGIMGLSELLGGLQDVLAPKPKIPENMFIDIGIKPQHQSQSQPHLKAAGAEPGRWAPLFGLGIGAPLGAYGAWRALKHLNRANQDIDYMKKRQQLEREYEEQMNPDLKEAVASEYKKGFAEGLLEKGGAESIKEFRIADLLPAVYGAAIPLGFLSGYYGLKSYFPSTEEDDTRDVPLKLKYRFYPESEPAQAQAQAQEKTAGDWAEDLKESTKSGIKWLAEALTPTSWQEGLGEVTDRIGDAFNLLTEKHEVPDSVRAATLGLGGLGALYGLYKLKEPMTNIPQVDRPGRKDPHETA